MLKRTYDYSNVYLIPQPSSINSREDVDLSVKMLEGWTMKIPIIGSPMKGIISPAIVAGLSDLGGIGINHRFQTETEMKYNIQAAYSAMKGDIPNVYGIAVGLNDNKYMNMLEYGADIICVDVANGYLDSVKRFCEEVANYIHFYNYDCLLMSGNVVTKDGVKGLAECGVDLIRIGIGNGGLCLTRQVTGVGYGQVTALQDCYYAKPENVKLVADGGIRNSGDAVKALAAGADLVMIGSLFGKTYESSANGIIYGMASRKLQDEYYYGNTKSIEGTEKMIKKETTLNSFISEFTWGMKSAFTYLGAKDIEELRENAVFVEII